MRDFVNFDLTNYNSYRLKAVCERAFFPDSHEDIRTLFSNKSKKKILIGSGHNIILSKKKYREDFVVFSGNYDKIELIGEDQLICQAGANMKQLTAFALEHSLSGLEVFYDIPSSLGGAVVMNAGASGEDMNGLIVKVWYYNPDTDEIECKDKSEIGFEYRNSFFQRNPHMIVCKALLKLVKNDKLAIEKKMLEIEKKRWAKQPRDFPNSGSVFKRPPNKFVGPMIEELGLKGYRIGGAMVSNKHAGFIVNYDNATGEDIINLIKYVQNQVLTKFEVNLEIEQRII
ncbi:UDP-N-acetylmuramate dehydrogenase [Zunongwangia endophytica]|uniref:UDP-N-acetylenolpyruvoylglucosamine reductase n=1 Tax=Zunongwangia endophytica TaxID=1808945 RepID=A0ABV8HC86_9FLAO|nr:UDP-N-acetylmuramate dehydrogenase [Zunongwangia endophytica]MDN3596242.1 UDP-N-acetylmuramate dehydrogenase [Zunongwangia endophytica]